MNGRIAAFTTLLLAGCSATSPFVDLGPLTDEQALTILAERTACPTPLAAELRLAFDMPGRRGTFSADAVFVPPAGMVVSAYKDLVVTERPVFDLEFLPDGYHIALYGRPGDDEAADGPVVDDGPLARFPSAHPRYRGLFWGREALVLPGVGRDAVLGALGDDGLRLLTTTLGSGASAEWRIEPDTLAVRSAVITAPGGERVASARYSGYRALDDGVFLPGRVVFVDEDEQVAMDVRIGRVERVDESGF